MVGKMNDLFTWNYDKSVSEVKMLVVKWSTLTVDLVEKLYKAREELSNPGSRSDLVTNDTRLKTWTGYLSAVGLERMTAHRWLERYIPEEHKLLTVEELETKKQQEERAKREANQNEYQRATSRVSDYRKTKIKSSEWGEREESILKDEIDREERIKRAQKDQQEEWKRKNEEKIKEADARSASSKINFDELNLLTGAIVKNLEKRQTFKESIRISHEGKDDPFVDAIMDYLETLADNSRRIEACHNIIKVCKGIANQLQTEAV
jgi:hypothetical protein